MYVPIKLSNTNKKEVRKKKENSTNSINGEELLRSCGIAYTLSLIGGRWKPTILWELVAGARRYSELKKGIPDVSERVLVLQLRELEQAGLVTRSVYAEVPPRVEYALTDRGWSMKDLLHQLSDWGEKNRTNDQLTS